MPATQSTRRTSGNRFGYGRNFKAVRMATIPPP